MADSQIYDALIRLGERRDKGELSEQEFSVEKGYLLIGLQMSTLRPPIDHIHTWSEFAESPYIPEMLVVRRDAYQEKFGKIIAKSGVEDLLVNDKAGIRKVSQTVSWNWAAFLFSVHWLAYRGVYGWSIALIFSSALTIASAFVPRLDMAPAIICFICGLYGNAWLLQGLARRGTMSIASHGPVRVVQPSWFRVGISIVVTVIALGAFILLDKETGPILRALFEQAPATQTSSVEQMERKENTEPPSNTAKVPADENMGGDREKTPEPTTPVDDPISARYSPAYNHCMSSGDAHEGVTMAIVDCLNAELDVQDAELNATYKRVMASLEPDQKPRLLDAQRAWIKFRDAKCDSENQTGGTQDRIGGASCLLQVTVRRTVELEQMQ
jgi:uncharacterized protein YecT (DUF1311 family)